MEPILCIGWDVGGWMGHKQGVAVAEWSPGSVQYLGKPTSFRLPFDRLLTLPEMLGISGVDAGRLEQLTATFIIILAKARTDGKSHYQRALIVLATTPPSP